MANDWLYADTWPSTTLTRAEETALADIDQLISTGALGCASARRHPASDSMSEMIGTWMAVGHAVDCPPTATCHRVAVLGNAARFLEAARLAITACQEPMPVCEVWPPMRRHLEEEVNRYLNAVVTDLARHEPESDTPYADICWDRSPDGESWEIRTGEFTVSISIGEIDGGLTVAGGVTVAGAWRARWSAGTGWSFGYLWADRLWEPQWPGLDQFGQYGDRVPVAAMVAAELATFLHTDPLSASVTPDGGFEDWGLGDVFNDEQAAALARRLGRAAGLLVTHPGADLSPAAV